MHRRPRSHSLACLAALALAAAPAGALSSRKLMQFGVEAAQQGLWREALFRWERAARDDPENARLRNNLAVAYESLGRLQEADQEYREARRLAPDSREIRDNYTSFQKLHPGLKGGEDATVPAAPSEHP